MKIQRNLDAWLIKKYEIFLCIIQQLTPVTSKIIMGPKQTMTNLGNFYNFDCVTVRYYCGDNIQKMTKIYKPFFNNASSSMVGFTDHNS